MKAIKTIACFDVTCPQCKEGIAAPNGSLLWSVHEEVPDQVTCTHCNLLLKLPKGYKS